MALKLVLLLDNHETHNNQAIKIACPELGVWSAIITLNYQFALTLWSWFQKTFKI